MSNKNLQIKFTKSSKDIGNIKTYDNSREVENFTSKKEIYLTNVKQFIINEAENPYSFTTYIPKRAPKSHRFDNKSRNNYVKIEQNRKHENH